MGEKFKENLKAYWKLFYTMFLIGIMTFGGGYAMIAVIQRELGEKRKWVGNDELLDYIAISQVTPGVIAVNIATFVGRKRKGIPGAIVATLGVVAPSIIIILVIAAVLDRFYDNEFVKHAFAGIRVCVCALIVNAAIKFIKQTIIDWLTLVTFICVFIAAAFTGFSTVILVLCVIAASIIITVIHSKYPLPKTRLPDAEKKAGQKLCDASGREEKK